MRVLRIERDLTITEHEMETEDWMTSDISWDAKEIGVGHDVWVDDEGLFSPISTIATVGGQKVPLPAYVLGCNGERTVGATMSIRALQAMIA